MRLIDLSGQWEIFTENGGRYRGVLPGTLDENGIGERDRVAKPWHPDVAESKKRQEMMQQGGVIVSRLTRRFTHEGAVRFVRKLAAGECPQADQRVFLEAERARALSLFIDGREIVKRRGSLSTPWVFEVTGLLHPGAEICLISDNTYPGMPAQEIMASSAATDETQTNWNGIIGGVFLRTEEEAFADEIRVLPMGEKLRVQVMLDCGGGRGRTSCLSEEGRGIEEPTDDRRDDRAGAVGVCAAGCDSPILPYRLRFSGACLREETVLAPVWTAAKETGRYFCTVEPALSGEALDQPWDEGEGRLQELHVSLLSDGQMLCEKTVRFGVRSFGAEGGRLVLNGRRIFLRGETNCAVFPETGHPPMDAESWRRIMKRYAAYGVNCVRFHSWCPPEAAFQAADELGIMVQPELSHWNPRSALATAEARKTYEEELREILSVYGNHPSFVMLSLGNELQANETGERELHRLAGLAGALDPTRLCAWGSNNFYGERDAREAGDFYTSASCHGRRLRVCGNRGPINTEYPGTERNYDEAMAAIREEYAGPVFGFEVGQYQVLPDFEELEEFRGVTRPDNLSVVRERAYQSGISPEEWKRQVEATGELSLLCYREEVESAMRTEGMSGLSLLGLQDFPGQGTALIGMMNSHLEPKPFVFASPERFREFFAPQRILVFMPRYTWVRGETIRGEIRIANYGREMLAGRVRCALAVPSAFRGESGESGYGVRNRTGSDRITHAGDVWKEADNAGHEVCDCSENAIISKYRIIINDNSNKEYRMQEILPGTTLSVGEFHIPLDDVNQSVRLDLRVALEDDEGEERLSSIYPVWIYPDAEKPVCPSSVYETEVWDERAKKVLREGGTVYLTPPSTAEALPHSIQAQFATDFWSVGTFPEQEGAMGQLIDNMHPIFADFPTESHTDWQWWPMASQRAILLPRRLKCIVAELDSYATLRPMAQLLEARCGSGRILLSSFGLQKLQQYPEARTLLRSIYRYLDSEAFAPEEELTQEELEEMLGRD